MEDILHQLKHAKTAWDKAKKDVEDVVGLVQVSPSQAYGLQMKFTG
jgi:hypothetical protein